LRLKEAGKATEVVVVFDRPRAKSVRKTTIGTAFLANGRRPRHSGQGRSKLWGRVGGVQKYSKRWWWMRRQPPPLRHPRASRRIEPMTTKTDGQLWPALLRWVAGDLCLQARRFDRRRFQGDAAAKSTRGGLPDRQAEGDLRIVHHRICVSQTSRRLCISAQNIHGRRKGKEADRRTKSAAITGRRSFTAAIEIPRLRKPHRARQKGGVKVQDCVA